MGHHNTFQTKDFLTSTLAGWAANLRYEDLSAASVRAAKLFWYDSLGCALGGSQQHDVRVALRHAEEMGGSPAATCFVSGLRTSPVQAAFLNSLMIRAMDYNDIYWKADPCHPSDIIAGPLALAEWRGLSGKDVILATVIAYEIEMRLCEAGVPGIREYGWHHATLTGFAAPIAAGRILGLTPAQIQHAIGISASRTCTLGAVTAGKLTNMKNTVDPMATRAGVESALLAELGYSGPEHVIDGKEGLFHVFGHEWDTGKLTGELPRASADHYRIIDCGMKSFPIEALSHAPLTAMMKVVKENGVKPADVAEIKVEVIARAADILGDPHKYRPNSKETADHSLPYCLAVGLIDGMVTPLQFKEARIKDAALIPVMDKVKVVPNQEFESLFPKFQPSRVTITTVGGQSFSKRVDVPKGDPRDPMTEEEIGVKFTALGRDVLGGGAKGEARCRELGALIMSMENERGVDKLLRMMTVGGKETQRKTEKTKARVEARAGKKRGRSAKNKGKAVKKTPGRTTASARTKKRSAPRGRGR